MLETSGGSLTISGNITDDNGSESLTLTGDGSGELVLSGSNSYGGGTNVLAGTLVVDQRRRLAQRVELEHRRRRRVDLRCRGRYGRAASSAVVAPVPEPGTLALLLAGALVAGFGVWRRRKGN